MDVCLYYDRHNPKKDIYIASKLFKIMSRTEGGIRDLIVLYPDYCQVSLYFLNFDTINKMPKI